MFIKILSIKNYIKLIIIAILLTILLISVISKKVNYGYYNKNFIYNNQKILSPSVSSLIITTVTGDKNFQDRSLVKLYKELGIIHLLVLSGSNLVIFSQFYSAFLSKNRNSHFVINILAVLNYFCYIDYLHPVARALLFTLFIDFLISFGFKFNKLKVFIILIFLTSLAYLVLFNSSSFLLSATFSLLTYFYSASNFDKLSKSPIISKYLLYPVYMTLLSLPICLFFFGYYNLPRSLVSNLIIVPFYDFLIVYMYLLYIVELIPGYDSLQIRTYLGMPIELVTKFFRDLLSIFELYNI